MSAELDKAWGLAQASAPHCTTVEHMLNAGFILVPARELLNKARAKRIADFKAQRSNSNPFEPYTYAPCQFWEEHMLQSYATADWKGSRVLLRVFTIRFLTKMRKLHVPLYPHTVYLKTYGPHGRSAAVTFRHIDHGELNKDRLFWGAVAPIGKQIADDLQLEKGRKLVWAGFDDPGTFYFEDWWDHKVTDDNDPPNYHSFSSS